MLTKDQKAINHDTWTHIHTVQKYLLGFAQKIMGRAHNHDQSKLQSPEVEYFAKYTPKLAECTYGSDEYKQYLAELKPCLDHHYSVNSHHPEHYKNGIDDMTLLDLVEMFCDWTAASERQLDGNINKSIEHNAERFNMSPQLKRILENTVREVRSS